MVDKTEGAGNRQLMLKASMMGSKVSFYLLMLTFVPVLIEMPYIFKLWLKNIPNYAILFCRLLLIKNLVEQTYSTLNVTIVAVGNIKKFQVISSAICLLPLIISYFLFYKGFPSYFLYVSFLIYSIVQAIITIYFANVNCGMSVETYLKEVVFRCFVSFFLVLGIAILPLYFIESGLLRFVTVLSISILFSLLTIILIGFTRDEKLKLITIIKSIPNTLKIKFFN
jgi:hypothetical protein